MTKIENWCLGTWEQQTDYLLCEWFDDKLPTLYQQDDIIFEYNQYVNQWSKKSCTIFSAIWAISDLFNYEFSYDEIYEIDKLSYTLGRVKNSWWRVQSAVKLVADYWNEHHSNLWKVAYYRLELANDEKVQEILDKWYTIMTNFNWNQTYIRDYKADLVLNWTEFGASTFWHAINIRKINWKRCCKDSNKWVSYNIYELEHLLREIKCYSQFWYIYTIVSQDALEEIKRLETLRSRIIQVRDLNSEIWHLVNDTTYKNSLHKMNNDNRKKLDDIEIELNKYK